MAIDENVDKIRELAADVDFPVMIDADHVLTELYAISNVPTVVMIDEDGRIACPNWAAFGNDLFKEFTGVESDKQHDRIRAWVRTGDAGLSADEAASVVDDLSPGEEASRLHFRLATALRDRGDEAAAAAHFDRAAQLAPGDWTIRRAMIPLRGGDPFGDEFFALYADWEAQGKPFHGMSGY